MEIKFVPRVIVTNHNAYREDASFETLVHAAMNAAVKKYCGVDVPLACCPVPTRVVVSAMGNVRLEWDENAEGPMVIVGRHTDGHYGLIAEIRPSNETAHILDGYQFVGYALDPIRSVYMRKSA
jgi:hypothetical protein